jgi:hypothetical protein
MKMQMLTIILSAELFVTYIVHAQGTLYVSNLNGTPIGSASIASDAWIAQEFSTGDDSSSYTLNSIQLLTDAASGTPSGFTVSLYTSVNGVPGNDFDDLVGSNPLSGGIFTYTASDLTLSSLSEYFVVLTAATSQTQGSYTWSAVSSGSTGNDRWEIPPVYFTSDDGSSWAQGPRGDVFQMAITATAVPEAPIPLLLGFGIAGIIFLQGCSKRIL